MITGVVPHPMSRPSSMSRWGIVIALKAKEERSKNRHEGDKGKGNRIWSRDSTPSLPPQMTAWTATEENLDLVLIPLPTIASSEGVQFQPFEVTLETSRGA